MDGIVYSNHTPQPEAWQVKKSQAPVFVSAVNLLKGTVKIQNRHHFTNLNELETSWSLLEDNQTIQEGKLELDIPVLNTEIVTIPYNQPDLKPGAIYSLVIQFALKSETLWAEAGYEITFIFEDGTRDTLTISSFANGKGEKIKLD